MDHCVYGFLVRQVGGVAPGRRPGGLRGLQVHHIGKLRTAAGRGEDDGDLG